MIHNNLHPGDRLGDPETHFWLTRSVARAMGINLTDALATGRLSPKGYSDMVTNCQRCVHVKKCQLWLATQAVQRCAAFEACANKEILEQLQ